MLQFLSFGSGSSGNCYCLTTENGTLLIDAGIGIRALKKHLYAYGISAASIHAILVTHDHADHIKAVGAISNEKQLPVYTTKAVHEGIVHNYCVTKKISEPHRKYVEKGKTFRLGPFEITPFGVPHDSSDNVGYCVVCEGITFCLMTDVGHVTDEMKTFITRANYLVIEANHDVEMLKNGPYPDFLKTRVLGENGHLSNAACAQALAENASPDLRHVWLCHLSEENNHPELARKTIEHTLRGYGIVAGADFELTVLKRRTPSDIVELK